MRKKTKKKNKKKHKRDKRNNAFSIALTVNLTERYRILHHLNHRRGTVKRNTTGDTLMH